MQPGLCWQMSDCRRVLLAMEINMSLQQLAAGLVLLAILGWFWRGRGVRELALRHAQARCRAEQLQLLDAHVAFAGWNLLADANGRKRLVRRYRFEFSVTGVDRHSGWLAMAGRRLLRLELPPYPMLDAGQEEASAVFRQTPAGD